MATKNKTKKKTAEATEEPVAVESNKSEGGVAVRALQNFGGLHGSFSTGDVRVVPKSVAEDLIGCGYCEKASKKKVETATV